MSIRRPSSQNQATESAEPDVLARAAWMYYMEDMTQQAIADVLGVSRIKVVRLLKEARAQSIVEIKVKSPFASYLGLEHDLRQAYDLQAAYVLPEAEDRTALSRLLCSSAAQVLVRRLQPNMVVGVGLGRTVTYLTEFIQVSSPIPCTITTLVGGVSDNNGQGDIYGMINQIAQILGGGVQYILAPFVVSSVEVKEALLKDGGLKESITRACSADMAIFSVGSTEAVVLREYGLITEGEIKKLEQQGAAGDALGRFFDDHGQEIESSFCDRIIGINLDQLRAIPTSILVAGGRNKYRAIRATLTGKLANILVTDANTAHWLLDHHKTSPD